MATALQHAFTVPGLVLPWIEPMFELQQQTTKFWAVVGESRIVGHTGGRTLDIPVLVYDASTMATRQKLMQWFEKLVDHQGKTATLTVTSEADRPPYKSCSFDQAVMVGSPLLDEAGALGGGAWANIRFLFRQHK